MGTYPIGITTILTNHHPGQNILDKPMMHNDNSRETLKDELILAKSLYPKEVEQIVIFVLSQEQQRCSKQLSPEENAILTARKIIHTMARMACIKTHSGQPIARQIAHESDKNNMLGACRNMQDQTTALKQMLMDLPEMIDLGKGIANKSPAAIAEFLLKWQWKAHNTNTSPAASTSSSSGVYNPAYYPPTVMPIYAYPTSPYYTYPAAYPMNNGLQWH